MFPLRVTDTPGQALRRNLYGVDVKVPLLGDKQGSFIFFDNANGTPPLKPVLKKMNEFLKWYSGENGSAGYKSLISSQAYCHSHEVIGSFVGADLEQDAIILAQNTTEAINKLSCSMDLKSRDVIVTTVMEHHSNHSPWRRRAQVEYVEVDDKGFLDLEYLQNILKRFYPRVKLVTVCGASNVTGHLNPVHEIAEMAHAFGARIMIDGSQSIPHCYFNMKPHKHPQHIDFLVFSGHNFYAPCGCGVLIGPRHYFTDDTQEPGRSSAMNRVPGQHSNWESPPRHCGGTKVPNIPGAYALAAALSFIDKLGVMRLGRAEQYLTSYLMEHLHKNRDVVVYGGIPRIGVVSFNIKGMPHVLVGAILCFEGGMEVSTGCFGAPHYVKRLLRANNNPDSQCGLGRKTGGIPGMVRISLGAYNTRQEIEVLLQTLERISRNKRSYQEAYYWSEGLGTYIPKGLPVEQFVARTCAKIFRS